MTSALPYEIVNRHGRRHDRSVSLPQMDARTFTRLAQLIERSLGLKVPPCKQTMLSARLASRLRQLDFDSYEEYVEHVATCGAAHREFAQFVNLVTTHTTQFFREPTHFEFLINRVAPELVIRKHGRPLRIWSAGCSTGEEVYSIAMTLTDQLQRIAPSQKYHIRGTDVSEMALQVARRAVYRMEAIGPIPEHYRRAYLLRSRDEEAATVRIIPALRSNVEFTELNFMSDDWTTVAGMDLVFCRNALIYFEPARQSQIVSRLHQCLAEGGFMFLGHAEGLAANCDQFVALGGSVYRKRSPKIVGLAAEAHFPVRRLDAP